jgi:hypothetical protein
MDEEGRMLTGLAWERGQVGRLEYPKKYCTPVDSLPITGSNPLSRLGRVDRPILATYLRRTLDA